MELVPTLCFYNSFHTSGKAFHWIAVNVPINIKVFDVVEVRALCRTVKLFHTNLDTTISVWTLVVHGGIVMLKQEKGFPKLLPQSWKHRIF
jgi:hypothetical protein